MFPTICVLLLVGTTVAKDPIGQNIIVLLIDGYGASLLNESKTEAKFGAEEFKKASFRFPKGRVGAARSLQRQTN
ncbi:hypothetical protein TELCIR_00494 [Teladorsagia circumcincta]|uniref:Alkaline phosphatase n=1 Tax=Teladorsagia circumcincta TaxID=45464 RepID=A0A2G9V4K3_TELCI|nr:hypothetical protein TELCIR_00494 [Teladorsagia circumcincta]